MIICFTVVLRGRGRQSIPCDKNHTLRNLPIWRAEMDSPPSRLSCLHFQKIQTVGIVYTVYIFWIFSLFWKKNRDSCHASCSKSVLQHTQAPSSEQTSTDPKTKPFCHSYLRAFQLTWCSPCHRGSCYEQWKCVCIGAFPKKWLRVIEQCLTVMKNNM